MAEIRMRATSSKPATAQYTTDGPIRYSTPPSAGPAITPASKSIELSATALGNASTGTRFGVIAWPAGIQKARPVPKAVITKKIGHALGEPLRDSHARMAAQIAAAP